MHLNNFNFVRLLQTRVDELRSLPNAGNTDVNRLTPQKPRKEKQMQVEKIRKYSPNERRRV